MNHSLPIDRQTRLDILAREIRHCQRRVGEEMLVIGQKLIEAKGLLYGGFTKWVEEQCGFSLRTAENLMAVASRLLEQPAIVATLPAALTYQLAAPSTSEKVIDAIATRLKQGEILKPAEVERMIVASRPPRPARINGTHAAVIAAAEQVKQELVATGGHVSVDGESIQAAITEATAEAIRPDNELVIRKLEQEDGVEGLPKLKGRAVVDYVEPGGRVTLFAPELAKVLAARQRIMYVIYVTE